MEEEHVPIFFAFIDTFCPICGEPVRKVVERKQLTDAPCQNEFFAHRGSTLIKYKDPVGAWELSADYKTANAR